MITRESVYRSELPTKDKELLDRKQVKNLKDGEIVRVLFPYEQIPNIYQTHKKHGMVYAVPVNHYVEDSSLKFYRVICGDGMYPLGTRYYEIRVWLPESPPRARSGRGQRSIYNYRVVIKMMEKEELEYFINRLESWNGIADGYKQLLDRYQKKADKYETLTWLFAFTTVLGVIGIIIF